MEPGEKVVEVRCGRRIFVCTSSTVAKEPGSLLAERYRAVDSNKSPMVKVSLDAEFSEYLGGVLRFYEIESMDFVPAQDSPRWAGFVRVAQQLRASKLLAKLGLPAEGPVTSPAGGSSGSSSSGSSSRSISSKRASLSSGGSGEQALAQSAPAQHQRSSSSSPSVSHASQQPHAVAAPAAPGSAGTMATATAAAAGATVLIKGRRDSASTLNNETSDESDDEEKLFRQLMSKINDREADGQAAARPLSARVERKEGEPEDELSSLQRRINELEDRLNRVEMAAYGGGGADAALAPQAAVGLRQREVMKLELQRLKYERDQKVLSERHGGKKLAYNLLVVGVTGTGKSSSLNTILDQQLCKVSGAQAQGTRGCDMRDGFISDDHFVSFIDTQGLGADTSVTDAELLSQIMLSTESISKMRIINNVLISFDTNTRATPATMANQLTLMELFGELRQSCFLILTKWNSAGVQSSWLPHLRAWIRKWRRAKSVEEITEAPPTYQAMYESYCNYIMEAMNNDEDAGAFSKMGTFLSFFQGRIIFMFNLDAVEIEDMENGELQPFTQYLYRFYRDKALQCLRAGSTRVHVDQLTFLKEDGDTLARVASRLILSRDRKIEQLEQVGFDVDKRRAMGDVFNSMAKENVGLIGKADYKVDDGGQHMQQIANLAGFQPQPQAIGCTLQ